MCAPRQRLKTGEDYNNISQLVGWENILISTVTLPSHRELVGLSIPEGSNSFTRTNNVFGVGVEVKL